MVDPLLFVESLTVERGGRIVLADLSFALRAGEALLVSGRNGAGKSTLLRTLSGLLAPVSGHIVYGLADEEKRGIESVHYLGYEDALKPSLTVGENLDFWARMLGARVPLPLVGRGQGWGSTTRASPSQNDTRTLAALSKDTKNPLPSPSPQGGGDTGGGMLSLSPGQALAAFGIARLIDLPAGYLSAGQKRRVALARLLLASRPIWLLDEPLIALDAGAQAILTAIMAAHVASGGAILVASHQPIALPCREIDLALAAAPGRAA